MDVVTLIGRLLFAALFIGSGIGHFAKLEAMTGYAKYKKLPAAKFGVLISGLFFLLGGIYIAIGLWVDLGALLIAITVILAGIIFHAFWKDAVHQIVGVATADNVSTAVAVFIDVGRNQ